LSSLTTNHKGAIAQSAVVHAAVLADIGVAKPFADERYDLIFDTGDRLLRVQCKWAVRRGDVVDVRCRTCRRARAGLVHRAYAPGQVDAFAAYCAELDPCYFLPFDVVAGRMAVGLRLAPTLNHQRLGINWAHDYEFERLDWSALKGP
jgi:PD-(D/E)XK endonuclease